VWFVGHNKGAWFIAGDSIEQNTGTDGECREVSQPTASCDKPSTSVPFRSLLMESQDEVAKTEAKRLYDIAYREKNREKLREVGRIRREKNKEKKRLYDLEYRGKNKDRLKAHKQSEEGKEIKKLWLDKNKDKIREQKRKWAASESGHKSAKQWRDKSPKALRNLYIAGAKRRNLAFDITEELFAELINKDCIYCGRSAIPKRNGLDRIDNNKGYLIDNVVTCCFVCNQMKGKRTVDEFMNHIKRIYEHATQKSGR